MSNFSSKEFITEISELLQCENNSEDYLDQLDYVMKMWWSHYNESKKKFRSCVWSLNLVGMFRQYRELKDLRRVFNFCSSVFPDEYFRLGPTEYRKIIMAATSLVDGMRKTDNSLSLNIYDPPNPMGIHSIYEVTGFSTHSHPMASAIDLPPMNRMHFVFQEGSTDKFGPNGITEEMLFKVLEVRLSNRMVAHVNLGKHELEQARSRLREARMWFLSTKNPADYSETAPLFGDSVVGVEIQPQSEA